METQYVSLPARQTETFRDRETRVKAQYAYETSGERSRGETWCLALFLVNLVGFGALFAFEVIDGGLQRIRPYNSAGQQCGLDKSTSGFPYIYYVVPDESLSHSVCVSQCPKSGFPASCQPNALVPSCDFTYRADKALQRALPYDSVEVWEMVCFAKDAMIPPQTFGELLGVLSVYSWLCVVPAGITIAFVVLMRYLTLPLLWSFVPLLAVPLGYIGYTFQQSTELWLRFPVQSALGVALFVLAGAFVIAAMYLWRRVNRAAQVVKLSCAFLWQQCTTLIVGLLALICIADALLLGACLVLMTYYQPMTTSVVVLLVYEVFSTLWFSLFWLTFFQMALANAVAKWYFQRQETLSHVQVFASIVTTLQFHMGQVCCAAFIHTALLPFTLLLWLSSAWTHCALSVLALCITAIQAFFALAHRFVLANLAYCDQSYWGSLAAAYELLVRSPLHTLSYFVSVRLITTAALIGLSLASLEVCWHWLGVPANWSFEALYSVFVCVATAATTMGVLDAVADSVLLFNLQDLEDGVTLPS